MAVNAYNGWKFRALTGGVIPASDTLRVLLLKSSYSFNPDHEFVSDLVPATNEVTGTGYSRQTLASKVVSKDDVNDCGKFTFANVVFTAINVGAIAHAVFYKFVTDDSASILLWHADYQKTSNGGNLTLQVGTSGAVWVVDESQT
jgi:hypothetical protein